MTDSRLPERYLMDRRLNRLSAEHFRAYVMATLWSVSNRTDGEVAAEDFPFIPHFSPAAMTALVAAGLWQPTVSGSWLIDDFANTQTSRHELEVLENARRRERNKKARQRANRQTPGLPGEVPGDVSRGTPQERLGRQGQEELQPHLESRKAEPVVGWHVAEIPQSDPGYCREHGLPLPCKKTHEKHAARAAVA